MAHAGVMRIEAGEQCGARGAAAGGIVELGEAHAGSGQFVDVGGWDFAAVAGKVGEAHVIDEDDDDVGPRGGGAAQGCVCERQADEGPPGDMSGGGCCSAWPYFISHSAVRVKKLKAGSNGQRRRLVPRTLDYAPLGRWTDRSRLVSPNPAKPARRPFGACFRRA